MSAKSVTVQCDGYSTSGLWLAPRGAKAALALAHGAGAGMAHRGMEAIVQGLAARRVATLRFNFLYMERGSKRPDAPTLAHTAVRAAAHQARAMAPDLPLFAGGRSFGGRMTSQAQASAPLPGVVGLIFFAFPLHPAGKPSIDRATHLRDVGVPMLFLQGERDALADHALLERTVSGLGAGASLHWLADADHSFHAPAKSGRKDAEILDEALDAASVWIDAII